MIKTKSKSFKAEMIGVRLGYHDSFLSFFFCFASEINKLCQSDVKKIQTVEKNEEIKSFN